MTEQTRRFLSGTPSDDSVITETPVLVSAWAAGKPPPGETMTDALAQRLVANFSHRRGLVIDLTCGDAVARAVRTARRRLGRTLQPAVDVHRGAEIVISGWPPRPSPGPVTWMARCRAGLLPGGCIAVVVSCDASEANPRIIRAARHAGMVYQQRIAVLVDVADLATAVVASTGWVHSEVLIFAAPGKTL